MAGSAMTSIVALWVPVVVFAHLFAAFWLFKTWLLNQSISFGHKRAAGDGLEVKGVEGAANNLDRPSSSYADAHDLELLPCGEHSAAAQEDEAAVQIGETVAKVQPLELEWQGIGCSYSTPRGVKVVLQDVWGKAVPGEMKALLGPSGAGKSTLMDVLAMRKSVGSLSGRLLIGGQPASPAHIRKTAYVPQDDNFVPTMTAEETMAFYAEIVLPASYSPAQRRARASEVLSIMGLGSHHKTLVGGQLPGGLMLRGLSGGERKRLSIATGVLAAPSIIFLDEPTSGLDSFAALTVMGYLRGMAKANGQVVIASIHQPRSAIWAMFDAVTLLAGGRMVYTGACSGMVDWLSGGLGYGYDAALHGVASDWALDLVATGFAKPERYYGRTMQGEQDVASAAALFRAKLGKEWGGAAAAGVTAGVTAGDTADGSVAGVAGSGDAGGEGTATVLDVVAVGGDVESGCSSPAGQQEQHEQQEQQQKGQLDQQQRQQQQQQQQQEQQQLEQPQLGQQSATTRALASTRTSLITASSALRHKAVQLQGRFSAGAQQLLTNCTDGLCGRYVSTHARGWWAQYRTLLWRELLAITRNPADVAGRTLTFCWVAITMGLLFFSMPDDSTSSRTRQNLLFNVLTFFCLMPYISMSLYSADKKFYIADASAKLYRPLAYYAAKFTATTPFQIISALVFCLTVYGMAGLRAGADYVALNATISILLYLISVQVLHCCAVAAPTQDAAFMLSIIWTSINLLLSGFFVTFDQLTIGWLSVFRYISALYYAFEGATVVEFQNLSLSCASGLPQEALPLLVGAFPNTPMLKNSAVQKQLTNPGADCIFEGSSVLDYFAFHRSPGQSIGILLGYLACMHVVTFVVMLVVARRERR